MASAKALAAGATLHNWTLRHVARVPELGSLTVYEFVHRSKARLLQCHRDDAAALFSISFKTPVSNSHGTPHILEHVVLCGSRLFPVRDPFFKMLDRSLAAYMNAWTASDHTTYPFITQNAKDYEHLRDVYWDAVFNPLLRPEDFRQEGWRVEEREGKRQIGGVVFNEMKGALSDADGVFGAHLNRHMFPNTCYEHVSGGEPLAIPALTHAHLVAFHRRHYHPSNALIVTYGRRDPQGDLQYFDEKLQSLNSAPSEKVTLDPTALRRFTAPQSATVGGPEDALGERTRQVRFIKSFLTGPLGNLEESFALSLLSHLLLDGPAAPMHQVLLESGLGTAYAPGTGYDPHALWTTFSVGLQGMRAKDTKAAEEAIDGTLLEVAAGGFSSERIGAALDSMELSLRHQPALFGLTIASRLAAYWARAGQSPLASCLQLSQLISGFRQSCRWKPDILQTLCRQYLTKTNPHVLTLTQLPDAAYFEKRAVQEAELLSTLHLDCDAPAEVARVDDVSRLPTLTEHDIQRAIQDPSIKPTKHGLFSRLTPLTNGITYFRALLPVSPTTDCTLLPILCDALTELGVEGMSAADFSEAIKQRTGGISFSPLLTHDGRLFVQAASYSLSTNADAMLDLILRALKSASWSDVERVGTLVQQMRAAANGSIADSGHSFANLRAASAFGPVHATSESLSGLTFIDNLNRITDLPKLSNELAGLAGSLTRLDRVCTITDTAGLGGLGPFRSRFEASGAKAELPNSGASLEMQVRMPFDTSFVSSVRRVEADDPRMQGALVLVGRILRSKYLHPLIREQGGAYGADASFNPQTRLFSFSTYRDPHPDRSVELIEKAGLPDTLTEAVLREARLAHFSHIDAPKSVGSQGLGEFSYGLTDGQRQALRDAILSTTADDIVAACGALKLAAASTCIIRKK